MKENIFPDLLNLQVCGIRKEGIAQSVISYLRIMYPTFRLVRTEFEIYDGEPFIYIGEPKYVYKYQNRPELHIIVSSTGEYDLTDRDTLINLAYSHKNGGWEDIHNNESLYGKDNIGINDKGRIHHDFIHLYNHTDYKHQGIGRPKYLTKELIDSWTSEQFDYNFKYLWVLGTIPDKELNKDRLLLDIVSNVQEPFKMITSFLQATEEAGVGYVQSSLLSFIEKSLEISEINTKSKGILLLRNQFKTSFRNNISPAVLNLLDSHVENEELRLLNFMMDVTCKGVKTTWMKPN